MHALKYTPITPIKARGFQINVIHGKVRHVVLSRCYETNYMHFYYLGENSLGTLLVMCYPETRLLWGAHHVLGLLPNTISWCEWTRPDLLIRLSVEQVKASSANQLQNWTQVAPAPANTLNPVWLRPGQPSASTQAQGTIIALIQLRR